MSDNTHSDRQALEAAHGKVWDKEQLDQEFEVKAIIGLDPLFAAKRLSEYWAGVDHATVSGRVAYPINSTAAVARRAGIHSARNIFISCGRFSADRRHESQTLTPI